MERRKFIFTATLSSIALYLSRHQAMASKSQWTTDTFTSAQWKIAKDGTFSLFVAQEAIIKNCYPAIDNASIHPIAIKIEKSSNGGKITYQLEDGELVITLGKSNQSFTVDCQLKGVEIAPKWLYPLASGDISNAQSFFKQGLGFGGPSGLFDITKAAFYHDQNNLIEKAWSYESYMTSGLTFNNNVNVALGSYVCDNFNQRTTFYNHIHRQLLIDKYDDTELVFVEAGFGTECIRLNKKILSLPTLHIQLGNQLYETMASFAKNIAKESKARNLTKPRFHWDSWYEYYGDYDYKKLDDFLTGLKTVQPKLPFQGILLDAGWSPLGDWLLSDERDYPGGMKEAFKRIANEGYIPGVFIGVFMVSSVSKLFKDHPDWILKGLDGKIMIESKGRPSFDNRSLYDERYFLDTSHPQAFEYLRQCFRTFRSWGVKFYKTDFFEWGLKDSTKVIRHAPGKTGVQYMNELMKMMREEMGEDAYWHGCIAPFAPMVGFADGMRVSYDISNNWDGNVQNMFQETMATQYFNNILFHNDPDVVFLRSDPATMLLNDTEIKSLALWSGMLGGIISLSDRIHKIFSERLDLLHFIRPGTKVLSGTMPFWYDKRYKSGIVLKHFEALDAYALLVLNYKEKSSLNEVLFINEIIGKEKVDVYEWNPRVAKRLGILDKIETSLALHESKLFFLSLNGKAPAETLGLSGEYTLGQK